MCYRDAKSSEKNSMRNKLEQVSSEVKVIGIDIDETLLSVELGLPKAVQIDDERFMLLRQSLSVVDMTRFEKIGEEHSRQYSRLLMFHPWENETDFLEQAKLCAKKCSVMYNKMENGLDLVEDQCNSLLRSYASR